MEARIRRTRSAAGRAAVPRRPVAMKTLGEALDRLLDGGFGPLVAYAARRRNLSEAEIARLREILEKEGQEDG